MNVREHPIVGIRGARGVRAEREIEDGRVRRQARSAAQNLGKGQIVGPDECHSIAKPLELSLEYSTPGLAELSRPHDHEYLPGLGPQLQDVVDEAREILPDRDRGLIVRKRIAQKTLIDGREQQLRVGKQLLPILARE